MTELLNPHALANKTVLLLGDSRMAFPIAKALHKSGVGVFAGVSIYSNYLEWSRYVRETFQHPSTDTGTDAALPYIFQWLDRHPEIDAIQPVSESASRLITRHRGRFEHYAKLVMPDHETILTCGNKGDMFRLCRALDLPLAAFEIVHSKTELMMAAHEIGFPLIVKPSTVDAEIFGRKAIIAKTAGELDTVFIDWPAIHPELIVQKFVHGPRHSVIFSAQNGRLLKAAQIAALRTHEEDGTGYTTLGLSVAPNPLVQATTEKLVQKLKYSSTGCTQFIVDPVSGEVTFMELNPRTSLARVSEQAGVAHSTLGLRLTLGLDVPDPGQDAWDTKTGTRYVWTKGDLMRIKKGLQAGTKSVRQACKDMLIIGFDAMRSHHAIFDPMDPMPAFGTYLNFIISRVRKSGRLHSYETELV